MKAKRRKIKKGRLRVGPQIKCTCSWLNIKGTMYVYALTCPIHKNGTTVAVHALGKCVPLRDWYKLWNLAVNMKCVMEDVSTKPRRIKYAAAYSATLVKMQKAMTRKIGKQAQIKKKRGR